MPDEKDEVVSSVISHLKWTVEDKKKWNQPVCGAADYLLDAFTKQMQEVYRAGYDNGVDTARQIAHDCRDKLIQDMRNYAKKYPKTTLELYLKREWPEES